MLILIIYEPVFEEENNSMSSKLVKQSLKRAKEGRGTFASSSSERNKIRKHKIEETEEKFKGKGESESGGTEEIGTDGRNGRRESADGEKRRHLAYFAIGLNDSGRVGELEKFLGKNGGKKKGKREGEDGDDAGDDWDVKDLFANAKKKS